LTNTKLIMSTLFSDNNNGAIQVEIENLLATMKQKDMRRYGDCLFSIYGSTKIYVSIREFVWTHIVHPYLAEATCNAFQEALIKLDEDTIVTLCVTDFCLPYPSRPNKIEIEAYLSDDFEILCDRLVYSTYSTKKSGEEVDTRTVAHTVRWKHPEDHKLKEISSAFLGTLGDLGFTNGTKVFLIPEMKLKQK
jgi:hypothetical protein